MKEQIEKFQIALRDFALTYRPDLESWDYAGFIFLEDQGWYKLTFTRPYGKCFELTEIHVFEEDVQWRS